MHNFSFLIVTYVGLKRRIERIDFPPIEDGEDADLPEESDDPRIQNLKVRDFIGICRTEDSDEIGQMLGKKHGIEYAGLVSPANPETNAETTNVVGAAGS